MRVLLAVCLLAVLSVALAHGQTPFITLDTIPNSAYVGDMVTLTGTLHLGGSSPKGAVVYIMDEDQFGVDDLLASAYVDSDGRFTAYWIAEDIDPTGNIEVYAVFEGDHRFNRLVSDMHDMYVYFDSPVQYTTPPAGDGYMKLYYSIDLEQSPRVLIAPSPSSYDEVRKHIIPVQEGIIELTAMLEREYEEGIWDVSFEVLDRGRQFASEEPDIVVSIVTDKEDPQCGVDYGGVAWPDNVKPVQVRVCSLDGYSDADVNAIAAHEFIHAMGLGHTFDIAGDMMCSVENDAPTCDNVDSKSNTPSSLNLAAIVAVYGTDGFSNPNNAIAGDETFTLVDYQNRNHLRLPRDQDYPTAEYPAGYILADRWQYGPGEEVFLDGFHFGEYEEKAAVTIADPHGNIVDVFGISVVDGYFSVYAGGYNLPGTYTARSYDHRGNFVAGTTFDVTDIPEGSDGWLILTDAGRYHSGSTMQISGYGPQSDHGPSRVLIADQDGSVVDDLSVYPAAGRFTATAYLGDTYQPGTYGVWLYDGIGVLITYTSFTLTVSGKDTATVRNPVGTSVPGCEETDECFIPSVVTVDVGGAVTWINEDAAAHTVTSGVLADGGPDGVFDSGLFAPETEFSHTFEEVGEYPYFCMVHPWMSGLVIVQEAPGKDTGATVLNPVGTSVPGCEETDECFIPSVVTVDVGGAVTWINEDAAAHTVTSGVLADGGPDGVFDSGLFAPETEFSHTFEEVGEYPYFCMVHPWMSGLVIVQDR